MNYQALFYGLLALITVCCIAYIASRRKTTYPTIEEMKWLTDEAVKAVSNTQYITSAKLTNEEKLSYAISLLDDAIRAGGMVIDPALREIVVEVVYRALKPYFKQLNGIQKENKVTEEQRAEFERLARPLIKYLNDNCNPHTSIIITPTSAELSIGNVAFFTQDYVRD